MYYDIIDDNGFEVLVDRKAFENYLKGCKDSIYVPKQEILAEFIDTYSENIDDIDWNYSSDKILVYLNEPIEETIAMQNQWRDYRDDDFEIEEEDY
jgi:hypothetical protein